MEEKSPILGSWINVYILVAAVLAGVITGLYLFTQYFK